MIFFLNLKFTHHLIIFLINLSLIFGFKPDIKKNDITGQQVKNNPHYRKECITKEKCRECSFEELKNNFECQFTGYKLIKHCSYYNDLKLVDDDYLNESCSENMKINSVYILFLIFLIIAFLSFYIRKSHRHLILSKTLEKLTILRKKA